MMSGNKGCFCLAWYITVLPSGCAFNILASVNLFNSIHTALVDSLNSSASDRKYERVLLLMKNFNNYRSLIFDVISESIIYKMSSKITHFINI